MITIENADPHSIEPSSKEEWDIWERYREVARSYGLSGQESHKQALASLRSDFRNGGIDPTELENRIIRGELGEMVKQNLLHARFYAGEELNAEEQQFHLSHLNLIS